jgi:hypothetical protein
MRQSRSSRSALVALVLVAALAVPAVGAVYRDHNVDGRRFRATLSNPDYGSYENSEVKFDGDHAYVHLQGGARLVLFLEEEEITDPHSIPAYDPRRGMTWEIDVKDLGAG